MRVGAIGTNDEIIDAIAIDIAESTDRVARLAIHAFENEAGAAIAASRRVQATKLEYRWEPRRAPKHHIGLTCVLHAARIASACADEQIIDPVAVNVACSADRTARGVTEVDTPQSKAVRAIERCKLNQRRKRLRPRRWRSGCQSKGAPA